MVVTTRFCDKCQREIGEKEKLHGIGVVYSYNNEDIYLHSPASLYIHKKEQWCGDCMASIGIKTFPVPTTPIPESTPSLEDIIKEIIREVIQGL